MKLLLKKIFRYIGETLGQFMSILSIILVGSFFLAGLLAGCDIVYDSLDNMYKSTSLASVEANFLLLNEKAMDDVKTRGGYERVEGRNVFFTETAVGGIKYDVTLYTVTKEINKYELKSGSAPAIGQCLIDEGFAVAHNIEIGDSLAFDINAFKNVNISIDAETKKISQSIDYETITANLIVSGTYYGSDLVKKINIKDTNAAEDDFAFVLANYEDAPLIADGAGVYLNDVPFPVLNLDEIGNAYNQTLFLGDYNDNTYDEAFQKYSFDDIQVLTDAYEKNGEIGLYTYSLKQADFPSVTAFRSAFDPIKSLSSFIPVLFYIVAAIITVIAFAKTVDNERGQIGVMQAVGISKGGITFAYVFYALFAAAIGATLGAVLGQIVITYLFGWVFGSMFILPELGIQFRGVYIFVALAVSVVIAVLSALITIIRLMREKPASAFRPKALKKSKRTLFERWKWFWSKLGFGAKMNIRNMSSHKVKMLLSSVGIIGCMMLLIGMLALNDRITYSLDKHTESVNYDLMCVLSENIKHEDIDESIIKDRDTQGYLKQIAFASSLSGDAVKGGTTQSINLTVLPSSASEGQLTAFTDVMKFKRHGEKSFVTFNSSTFLLGESLAKDLGVSVGDELELRVPDALNRTQSVTVTVTDIVDQYVDRTMYCSYEALTSGGFDLALDRCFIRVVEGTDLDEAANYLKDIKDVRSVHTSRELIALIEDNISLLTAAVLIFVIGAAVLAIAIIYNITSINVNERKREIATLTVLGYNRFEINNMIMVENMVITLLGVIIGIPCGYGLLLYLISICNGFDFFFASNLSFLPVLLSVVLTFAFAIIATMMLQRKMNKISMVEALKSVE